VLTKRFSILRPGKKTNRIKKITIVLLIWSPSKGRVLKPLGSACEEAGINRFM